MLSLLPPAQAAGQARLSIPKVSNICRSFFAVGLRRTKIPQQNAAREAQRPKG
jgi:hypothetical protein